MELKFDPEFRVIKKYLSKIESILIVNSNWLKFLGQNDSIFFKCNSDAVPVLIQKSSEIRIWEDWTQTAYADLVVSANSESKIKGCMMMCSKTQLILEYENV